MGVHRLSYRIYSETKGHRFFITFRFAVHSRGNKSAELSPCPCYDIRRTLPICPLRRFFFTAFLGRYRHGHGTFRKHGALIVFEPSTPGDRWLFQEALSVSHIVKISHELGHTGENLLLAKQTGLSSRPLARRIRFLCRLPLSTVTNGSMYLAFPSKRL